jgi:hypothetical protein
MLGARLGKSERARKPLDVVGVEPSVCSRPIGDAARRYRRQSTRPSWCMEQGTTRIDRRQRPIGGGEKVRRCPIAGDWLHVAGVVP